MSVSITPTEKTSKFLWTLLYFLYRPYYFHRSINELYLKNRLLLMKYVDRTELTAMGTCTIELVSNVLLDDTVLVRKTDWVRWSWIDHLDYSLPWNHGVWLLYITVYVSLRQEKYYQPSHHLKSEVNDVQHWVWVSILEKIVNCCGLVIFQIYLLRNLTK